MVLACGSIPQTALMLSQRQRNITAVLRQASADELYAGKDWYNAAHALAKRLHPNLRVAAAAIAATSPGLRWERNVECAERLINGKPLTGLGVRWYDGVRKAQRVIKGQSPETALRGNKVRAFFACILDPTNVLHCCIDGHAYAIWAGKRIPLDSTPALNNRLYRKVASDYAVVAKFAGMSPCQLQAITWLTWRRIHNVAGNKIAA